MSDSIWKKEISFGKKKDKAPDVDAPVADDAAPKQSFLKKELSFKKKDKADAPVFGDDAPKQSFLKKDISFGRKKRDKAVERLAEEAAQSVTPSYEEYDAGAPGPSAAQLPTAIAEAAVAAMPDPTVPEPSLPEPAHAPEFAAAPPIEPILEAFEVEQPAAMPYIGLSPEIVAGAEPALPEPPMPAYEPLPLPEEWQVPPIAEEWAEPQPVAVEPEPWLAEPELPPAPEAAPAVVLHPPVPAAELAPVVEPKVPFWKKDVSLSRGKSPKAPKAPKAAKAPKAPKAAKDPSAASAPFWKKELSLKRGPKAVAADAPTEALPAVAKTSALKRELSMPKLSLPSFSGRGGSKGGHNVKRFVGLKIGASQLAAARISNNGSAELLQLARDPLAQGIIVAGELREPDALAEALKAFFAKHKLPRKNVRIGIASNRIGVRIFDVVGIDDEKQLANAVQFRAQEALPIPLDEAVLDYRVLDESVDAEGRHVKRVLLVVAYRDLVDRYIGACRKAGIGLAGIDLEAFALLRSLGAPTERGESAMVAVAIGHDRSTFAVTDGRVCEFTRVLEWGGWSLNIALARALDTAPSEVEGFKRGMSLDTNMVIEGLTPDQSAIALDAVRKQLQSFARELVSSLQFYQNQPGSLAIGSIVITGGTAHMPGLAQELERLIGVRVVIGDPLARLKYSKKMVTPEPLGSMAVAIGLGIED